MDLLTFFLRILKAEQFDFLGKNSSGAGALQKKDSPFVLLLQGAANCELKIL